MKDLSGFKIKELWSIVWKYLAIILTSAVIRVLYQDPWWISALVHHLTDAFMVAGILAICFELWSANKLIYRVGDDLAERLVGRGLPKTLRKQIQDIVKTSLVRDNFVKTYRLSEVVHETQNKMQLDLTLSYSVRNYNYSEEDVSYAPSIAEEVFYSPEYHCVEYRTGSSQLCFDQQQLEQYLQNDPTNKVKRIQNLPKVTIKHTTYPEDNVCTVRWQYRIYMPRDYSDIQSFGSPTIGATFELLDIPPGYDFTAGKDMEHLPGSKVWVSQSSFMEGQHLRSWWFKRASLPAKTA